MILQATVEWVANGWALVGSRPAGKATAVQLPSSSEATQSRRSLERSAFTYQEKALLRLPPHCPNIAFVIV